MKKFLGLIVALILTVMPFATSYGQIAMAEEQSLDDADRYFLEFVLSDTTLDGDMDFTHRALYDNSLNENGREYVFSIGDVNGYVLMIEISGDDATFYEIEELYYNSQSPFYACQGLPVYISHNVYLEYKNQNFYDLTTDSVVEIEVVNDYAVKGFKYFGDTLPSYTHSSVTVEYATKTTDIYSIQYDLPNISGGTNTSCANTAGAVIFTYYDRFYENIIPNFVPYLTLGPTIVYKSSYAEVIQLVNTLGELMLIGEPHEGTTFTEFQLGMQTYATQQGYTYTSTNLFSNGSFNFNNYKNAVENNIPVAIFLINFSMMNNVTEGDGQDTISSSYCDASHVEVGCGYRVDTYYDANGNVTDTRIYLKVASGLMGYGIGYLNINGVSNIARAISTQIS